MHHGPGGRLNDNGAEDESQMTYTVTHEDDVTVVDVEGELVVGNRRELKEEVVSRLEQGDEKFLLDFAGASYIDSSGLGVLVSLSKKIREGGGELRLSGLDEDLETLFELTKLDTLFQIAESRNEALAEF